jgi:hypothetical protein
MIEKIKDLTKLGRDKIIIVDNLSFKLQRSNSIWIKSFYSDNFRNTLKKLSVILEKIDLILKKLLEIV